MTGTLTFDAADRQIDITDLVNLFYPNGLDPEDFVKSKSLGGHDRAECEAIVSNWTLTPLASIAVKDRMFVGEDLSPKDFHPEDVFSDLDAKVRLLQWAAEKLWRIERVWMRDYEGQYGNPVELMAGIGVNCPGFWWLGLYLQGDRVLADFKSKD